MEKVDRYRTHVSHLSSRSTHYCMQRDVHGGHLVLEGPGSASGFQDRGRSRHRQNPVRISPFQIPMPGIMLLGPRYMRAWVSHVPRNIWQIAWSIAVVGFCEERYLMRDTSRVRFPADLLHLERTVGSKEELLFVVER